MSHQDRIYELINAFSERAGLPAHDFGASPLVEFALGDELVIALQYDVAVEQLVVFAEVDTLPENASPALLRQLLSANWFWQETDGATLSLEPCTQMIFLAQKCHAAAVNREDDLTEIMESMVDQVRHQREVLRDGPSEELGDETEPAPESAPVAAPQPWSFA